ncbi:MAG: hypothetical protein NTZ64_10540 [Polaromonas sp.]|nr:hypothetical protein [Polaromonas sp.]
MKLPQVAERSTQKVDTVSCTSIQDVDQSQSCDGISSKITSQPTTLTLHEHYFTFAVVKPSACQNIGRFVVALAA